MEKTQKEINKNKDENKVFEEEQVEPKEETEETNIDKSFMDRLLNKKDNEKLEELEKEKQDLKESLLRTQAEFSNYKKRVEAEKSQLSTFANEKIIYELLSTIDNLDRALDSIDDLESAFYQGVLLTRDELISNLNKFGLSEIDNSINFDPNFHHAVMQEDGENPGEIIDVFQKGYMLKDKVIRASIVKVSK